jgi:hypothetical protein
MGDAASAGEQFKIDRARMLALSRDTRSRAVPTLMRIARRSDAPPPESLATLAVEAARLAGSPKECDEIIEALQALFGENLGHEMPPMTKPQAIRFLERLAGRVSGAPEKVPVAPLIIDACVRNGMDSTDATRRQLRTALEVLLDGNWIVRENGEIIQLEGELPH